MSCAGSAHAACVWERGVWRSLCKLVSVVVMSFLVTTYQLILLCFSDLSVSMFGSMIRPAFPASASERPRPRNCIARRHRPVQLELNSRIRSLIRTRKAHRGRRSTPPTSHIDLRALHVQLCTGVARRSVQRNELRAEEIPRLVSRFKLGLENRLTVRSEYTSAE